MSCRVNYLINLSLDIWHSFSYKILIIYSHSSRQHQQYSLVGQPSAYVKMWKNGFVCSDHDGKYTANEKQIIQVKHQEYNWQSDTQQINPIGGFLCINLFIFKLYNPLTFLPETKRYLCLTISRTCLECEVRCINIICKFSQLSFMYSTGQYQFCRILERDSWQNVENMQFM